MKKITVVVVDDHRLIREMWAKLFATRNDIVVVGDCGVFDKAIELIKLKKPDIVLLDINLPPASGLDAVPLILKYSPGTKIIAVSMHTEPVYAKKMIKLGAKGYVSKNSSYEEMFNAVDKVRDGKLFICTEMRNILSDRQLFKDEASEPGINDLTFREIEIVKFIKKG
ncbi:MAG TPA: response regulator transcription factor, partial [Chitinophagaceae bacterium]|nr:response regulator transcription factor [Chitinophagaceae bacterium]